MLILSALAFTMLTGCSGNGKPVADSADSGSDSKRQHDPVTLTFFNPNPVVFPEDQFNAYLEPAVKKKYPYISFKFIQGDSKVNTLENLIARSGYHENTDKKTLKWDLVTIPTYTSQPRIGTGPFPNNLTITKQSKHKAEAFLVVATALSEKFRHCEGVKAEQSRC